MKQTKEAKPPLQIPTSGTPAAEAPVASPTGAVSLCTEGSDCRGITPSANPFVTCRGSSGGHLS
jgi:hypothetical protein